MKAQLSFMASVLTLLVSLHSQAAGSQLQIKFASNNRTPAQVQQFITKLFNQKCQQSVARAYESHTTPQTSLEDNYEMPGQDGLYSAHYDIVYDQRFPRDMVATIAVNYNFLPNGQIRINLAQILGAYDTSYCDIGMYKPSDLK